MGEIHQALVNVANDLGTIEKDTISAGRQSYKAFGVDTVYRHLRPLFAKHGVTVVPQIDSVKYGEITASSGNLGVSAHVMGTWLFYATDGSYVELRFAAEGHDYQDKATNKAVQQAFKYGLIQMFQISTGEVDADAAPLPERAPVPKEQTERIRLKKAAMEAAGGDVDEASRLFGMVMEKHLYAVDDDVNPESVDAMIEWLENVNEVS